MNSTSLDVAFVWIALDQQRSEDQMDCDESEKVVGFLKKISELENIIIKERR